MTECGKFIRVPEDLWFDDRLTGTEKLVLISLLCHFNYEQRRSWPSQYTIAQECRISEFWVRETLKSLTERGYITTFKEKGRGNVKIYAINPLPPRTEPESNRNSVPDSESEVTGTEYRKENDTESQSNRNSVVITQEEVTATQFPLTATQFRIQEQKKPQLSFEKPQLSCPLTATQFPSNRNSVAPNQIKNKTKNQTKNQTKNAREKTPEKNSSARSAAKAFDFGADFEAFWAAYPKPKHPDKTPTRKKYEALRKKGATAEELLAAATNYAAAMESDRTPRQFIKRGATFLGPQEPWRDYVDVEQPQEAPAGDGPPDATKVFPNLAAWWRHKEASNDGAAGVVDVPGIS